MTNKKASRFKGMLLDIKKYILSLQHCSNQLQP